MGNLDKATSKDKPTTPKVDAVEDPEIEPTPEEARISLKTYCDSLGNEGLFKFSSELISARLMQWSLGSEDRTYPEWEKLYLQAQQS
jgi:hypothetical protein